MVRSISGGYNRPPLLYRVEWRCFLSHQNLQRQFVSVCLAENTL